MSILENNLTELSKIYPSCREDIENSAQEDRKFLVTKVDARDGSTAVMVEKNGEKIRLNSAYQPLKEAKKWAEQYNFQNLQVNVIMYGMGNGIFVREILSRIGDDARLFIYEENFEILREIIQWEDLTDILTHPQVHLMFGTEGEGILDETLFSYVTWATIPTQVVCCHPGYEKIYEEEIKDYWDKLKRLVDRAKVSRNTSAYFAHLMLENAIPNLLYVKESNHLEEMHNLVDDDVPVIIVSAGPSLDKNAQELKRAKGRAVIIAVDTAVRYLEKHAIDYDFMVTVDPEKPVEYFTEEPACKDKPLFCAITANHEIMKFHTGRKIWESGDLILNRLYAEYGITMMECHSGGSVATTAAMIARFLGAKNVILVGQDLAYGEEGSHIGGEMSTIVGEENQNIWVDGINGGKVKSRWDWTYFREWFENIVKVQKDLNLVDATEGGALIHGSRVMKLSDAIDEYCKKEVDFEELLSKIPPTFSEKEYEKVRKDIFRIKKEMRNIQQKSEKGVEYCKEYLENLDTMSEKRHDEILKEIGKTNRFIMLQKIAADILDIYTSDLAMSELTELNKMTGDEKIDEKNSVQNVRIIYASYVKGAGRMMKLLDETLEKL